MTIDPSPYNGATIQDGNVPPYHVQPYTIHRRTIHRTAIHRRVIHRRAIHHIAIQPIQPQLSALSFLVDLALLLLLYYYYIITTFTTLPPRTTLHSYPSLPTNPQLTDIIIHSSILCLHFDFDFTFFSSRLHPTTSLISSLQSANHVEPRLLCSGTAIPATEVSNSSTSFYPLLSYMDRMLCSAVPRAWLFRFCRAADNGRVNVVMRMETFDRGPC